MTISEGTAAALRRDTGFVLKKIAFGVQVFLFTFAAVTGGFLLGLRPQATFGARDYVIRSGDTLSALADSFLGKASLYGRFSEDPRNGPDLRRNPDLIFAGAPLFVPGCAIGSG